MYLVLIGQDGFSKLIYFDGKKDIHTNKGIIRSGDIKPGRIVETHKGYKFLVVEPTAKDIVQNIRGGAKPIYEYHSGLFGAMLGLQPGKSLLEAGTGSAGATLIFAAMTNPGKVYTFEREKRFYDVAKKDIELSGLDNIVLFNDDVSNAPAILKKHKVKYVDAVFLDLQDPEDRIGDLSEVLRPGGFFGVYTPVFDSVVPVWREFEKNGFVSIQAVALTMQKIIVKKYARFDQELFGFPGFFVVARKFGGE